MPRGREPRATRRDDRSQARQHRSCPWGPQPPQPHTLLFPAARLSARGPERQGRLRRRLRRPGLRPVLDPARAAHQRSGSYRETGHARPQGSPRASPACPQPAENRDKRLHTGRLTRPRSFRDDIGRALLTMLRTVAGLRDRAPRPWTGSWTEPSVQTVQSGPSVARLRGIRAASAHGARGRTSHNPPVVGSSPTRPT